MEKFYFDIAIGDDLIRDDAGSLLSCNRTASREMIASLVEIAETALMEDGIHTIHGFLRDGSNRVIFSTSIEVKTTWLDVAMPAVSLDSTMARSAPH